MLTYHLHGCLAWLSRAQKQKHSYFNCSEAMSYLHIYFRWNFAFCLGKVQQYLRVSPGHSQDQAESAHKQLHAEQETGAWRGLQREQGRAKGTLLLPKQVFILGRGLRGQRDIGHQRRRRLSLFVA